MAGSVCVFVKFCLWIFYIISLIYTCESKTELSVPIINSVQVLNETSFFNYDNNQIKNKYIVQLNGTNFLSGLKIRPTFENDNCDEKVDVTFKTGTLLRTDETMALYTFDIIFQFSPNIKLPKFIYFCVSERTNTIPFNKIYPETLHSDLITMKHLGDNVSIVFRTKPQSFLEANYNTTNLVRNRRASRNDTIANNLPDYIMKNTVSDDSRVTQPYLSQTSPILPIVQPGINNKSTTSVPREQSFFDSIPSHITKIIGYRLEQADKGTTIDDNGVVSLLTNTENILRLFGSGITKNTIVTFTKRKGNFGTICLTTIDQQFKIEPSSYSVSNSIIKVNIPLASKDSDLYFCTKETAPPGSTKDVIEFYDNRPFVHQGADEWLVIRSHDKLLPMWMSIVIVIVCLSFSALFSGLNLGLMSLDRTELKILINTGTPNERKYAEKIQPVRDHGNYLLCSILLGNVLVNSIFTILLDDLTSGLVAVIGATLLIVLFGEITPQAICSRYGLAVGAKTILITKAVMLITIPLAYPISRILDWILGEEIGNVYNRERLKELVKVTTDTNDLDKDEVNIISGALELRKKTVADVMTRIEDVFMLDIEAILNFETVSEIMKSGFSRIPVFEGNRTNIITMLYIKDLAFVDPDDNTPLKTLCQFYQNPVNFVFEDVTLDVMFKQFKEGNKGHMAFVQKVNNEGEGDPFYETIGLVTLEDVIEELIQAEIMDETDVFTDNRSKRRRNEHRKQDFTIFAERRENQRIRISPQLTLATFQYLSTSIDLFKPEIISETILRRMLKQDIIMHVKKNKKDKHDPATIIYQQGKPADYFVLILEGRVEVTVGRENLVFEGGPFTYFGKQALIQNFGSIAESPTTQQNNIMGSLQSVNMDTLMRHTFVPDYTVRTVTEVLYIKIKRSLYMAAKRATLMERSQKDNTVSSPGDQFDDEVEKLLHSLEEDGNSVGRGSPIPNEINEYIKDSNRKPSMSQLQTSPSLKDKISPSFAIVQPTEINGTIKKNSIPVTVNSIMYGDNDRNTHDKEEERALLSPAQNTKS